MLNKLIESNIQLEEKLKKLNQVLEEEVIPLLKFYSENISAPKCIEEEVDKLISNIEENK